MRSGGAGGAVASPAIFGFPSGSLFGCSFFLGLLLMFLQTVYMACDQASVDTTTGQCSSPVWVQQPQLFPQLDAADGITIATAILACWAIAYVYRRLRRVGE